MSSLRAAAALALVVALGAALAAPIVTAERPDGRSRLPAIASPTPEATEDPGKDLASGAGKSSRVDVRMRLFSGVARACLRPAPLPEAPGIVAAYRGGSVALAPPGGDPIATFQGGRPVSFSPSGRFVAAGVRLYDIAKQTTTELLGAPLTTWAWSPVSDCLVGIEEVSGKVIMGRPGSRGKEVWPSSPAASDFAVSPDGRSLALIADGRLWSVNLRGGSVALNAGAEPVVDLWGYSPNGKRIFFSTSDAASGRCPCGLRSITVREGRTVDLGTVPGRLKAGDLHHCGDRTLSTAGRRLVALQARRAQRLGDGPKFSYGSLSCSPDGEFMVAARVLDTFDAVGTPEGTLRLTLMDSAGLALADLGVDGSIDEYVGWGRGDSGVVFVRYPSSRGRVWHLGESGDLKRSSLRLPTLIRFLGTVGVDWSMVPRTGAAP